MQTSTRPRTDVTCRTKLGRICSFAYAGDQILPWQRHSSARQVRWAYQILDF